MLLSIQPNVLCGMMQNDVFRGRGLTARFLYSMPKSRVGSRDYQTQDISHEVSFAYEDMIYNLLDEQYNPTTDEPEVIILGDDAKQELEAFFLEMEPKLKDEYNSFSDWAGKLCGAVVRISGILCRAEKKGCSKYLKEKNPLTVDGETMQRAIDLGRYYLKHAEAAYLLMGADKTAKQCEYVLQAIKREGCQVFNQRDVMRMCRSFKKAAEVIPVMERLSEYGYIRQKAENKNTTGRPKSPMFEVNPAVFADDE